jgi:hypothetical protein
VVGGVSPAEAAPVMIGYPDEHSGLRSYRAEAQAGDTRGRPRGGGGGWLVLILIAAAVLTAVVIHFR